jgi:hypothetical protein
MYSPREASKDHLYTNSFVSLLLLIPLALMMLFSKGEGLPHLKVVMAKGKAQGVIEQVEPDPNFKEYSLVHYRFVTADGREIESGYAQDTFNHKTVYSSGQPVSIVYSRWFDGADAIEAVFERSTIGFYIFITCFGLMFLCVLFSFWNLRKLMKHTAEEHLY